MHKKTADTFTFFNFTNFTNLVIETVFAKSFNLLSKKVSILMIIALYDYIVIYNIDI